MFFNSIRSLNIQWKNLLKSVSAIIEKDIKNDIMEVRKKCCFSLSEELRSGKSFILKLLVAPVKRWYKPAVDAIIKSSIIDIASLTSVMTRQIFEKTAFCFLLIHCESHCYDLYTWLLMVSIISDINNNLWKFASNSFKTAGIRDQWKTVWWHKCTSPWWRHATILNRRALMFYTTTAVCSRD